MLTRLIFIYVTLLAHVVQLVIN